MSVTVQIGGSTATVKTAEWSSPDIHLLRRIQAVTADFEAMAYDPWPDMTMAKMAIDQLGGKIIGQTKPPAAVPGRIY